MPVKLFGGVSRVLFGVLFGILFTKYPGHPLIGRGLQGQYCGAVSTRSNEGKQVFASDGTGGFVMQGMIVQLVMGASSQRQE